MKALLVSVFLSVGMLASASSALAANATGNASVKGILPITLVHEYNLNFGTGIAGELLTIVWDQGNGQNNGSALSAPMQVDPFNAGSSPQAGQWDVFGSQNEVYTVTGTQQAIPVGLTNPVNLDCRTMSQTSTTQGDLNDPYPPLGPSAGADWIKCGGTLQLDINDTTGPAQANYNLTVQYQ